MDQDSKQDPAADAAQAAEPMSSERLQQVHAFAQHLTLQLAGAINDDTNLLCWDDAVFACGLALRSIGEVVNLATSTHSGLAVSAEDVQQRIDALLDRARRVRMTTMMVKDEAEARAYFDSAAKGFH